MVLFPALPLEKGGGGIEDPSAVVAIFLSNLNVVGHFTLLGGNDRGASSSFPRSINSGMDTSLDDTYGSFAVAVLPFRDRRAACASCGVLDVGS